MNIQRKLWHCVNARSFRALWVLEELGLPYELEVLPFPPRVLHKQYKTTNALGTVPYFVDGDTAMTESVAICEYLVARYGDGDLSLAPTEHDYGAFLNWLYFGESTLTFPQTLIFRYRYLESETRRVPQVADDYARWFLSRLDAVRRALEKGDHLCGGRFTIADVSVGYALMLAEDLGLRPEMDGAVCAYWDRLREREGFEAAMRRQRLAAEEAGVSPVSPITSARRRLGA
ncbi:glutathione S-transferase family protein [Arhodomonas sp. SL1]|uniref:glutathione S-transferase family protein n=1 Tax=Arhodomonas sp. SL1 TaxID=3425691 RepID=UPI003F881EA4